MSANHLIERLTAMFREKLLIDVPSPATDLLEAGILDSLTLVDLLLHLESEFGHPVAIESLDIESFRSLDRIAASIAGARKTAG
ncbi:MAG: phosphopantetheine-binding protein [Planctomycetaceae bacterium]